MDPFLFHAHPTLTSYTRRHILKRENYGVEPADSFPEGQFPRKTISFVKDVLQFVVGMILYASALFKSWYLCVLCHYMFVSFHSFDFCVSFDLLFVLLGARQEGQVQ